MLHDVVYLTRADVGRLMRVREVWVWTFFIPIFFFYFLGLVSRGGAPGGEEKDDLAVFVPSDAGYLADQLLYRLERNYRVTRIPDERQLAQHSPRLRIPEQFTAKILAKQQALVRLERDGGGITGDYDRVRVARAVYTTLADYVATSLETDRVTAEAMKQMAQRPHLVTVDVRSAGFRKDPPTGTDQSVPGTMVMFTLLVMFTTGAITLAVERNTGVLRRLAATQASRGAIVLAKWGSRWILGLVQIAYAMVVGTVVFGVHWGSNLPAISLLLICYAALAASLGVLLGNFARTERQVIGFGVVATNLLAALGGCWWPIEVTPRWAQQLSLLLPTGWAMDAMHKLMSFGMPASSVLPHLAAMASSALVAGWLVARRFRFQ